MVEPIQIRRTWPIRTIFAGMVVVAMLLVAAVLITLNWISSRNILIDSAAQTAYYAAHATSEHARRLIEPASATLRTLSLDPMVTAARQDERMARMRLLAGELMANPLLSAIYVGYANGDFLLIRPLVNEPVRHEVQAPEAARFLLQMVTRDEAGESDGTFYFYDAQLKLVQQRHEADYHFDPRERAWYQKALLSPSTVLSDPYVFFTTREIGISLSQQAPDAQAVIGLDITLDDLGKSLADLRMSPGSEIALVDWRGAVVAYSDMPALRAATPQPALLAPVLGPIESLPIEALSTLRRMGQDGVPLSYQSDGRTWWGVVFPLEALKQADLRMLLTVPAEELLGDLQRNRTRMILITCGLIVLFLPMGWWAGRRIGQALEQVAMQAQHMSGFNFSRPPVRPTRIAEVAELNRVMHHVSSTVEAFLSMSQVLGTEPGMETMLNQVLDKLVHAARCQGGAIYLRPPGQETMTRFAAIGAGNGLEVQAPPHRERPTQSSLCDPDTGAQLQRIKFLLQGRTGETEGLLVLLYQNDGEHATPEFHAFAAKLTGMMTAAIETRKLIDAQKQLFEAIIRMLADAIDAKSPYTAGHCERVPALALMLVQRMSADTTGPYADFHLTEDERYAFFLAAWLHDCGKITTPEHIVDKATKLELIYNRIHEVRTRFEVLWRDAEIAYLQALLQGQDAATAAAERDRRQAQLQDDFAFVAACNIGGEFLSDEAVQRLARIGKTTWLRHFDDRLGLSSQELHRRQQELGPSPSLPVPEPLLADKPEHRIGWGSHKPPVERGDPRNIWGFDMKLPACRQDQGELHNLSIRRGTLTEEDRFAINEHIVQTLIMLKKLPWPRHLERVPDIAANHHEKMDGTGYPRRLPGSAMGTTERIMAVADIFEALTAADRPYKGAKPLSESLRIMAAMCQDGHLDTGLFLYFLRSNIWRTYAGKYLQPSQMDDVDMEAIAAMAQDRSALCR